MTHTSLSCFKAYDIRGKVPDQLNSYLAHKIGICFGSFYNLKKVVVGQDIRLTSKELLNSLVEGLRATGTDVLDLGICGTEEIYHAAFSLEKEGVDGGVIVTASHNPSDYNGMKFVTHGARPVTGENGLDHIGKMISSGNIPPEAPQKGQYSNLNNKQPYVDHLLSYVDVKQLQPLKIVVNSGNGCAGPILDILEKYLPFTFIKLNHQPDGSFPNGVPNPLLPENRKETSDLVRKHNADMGVGWDGDFDRCFLWDENGTFIEGYYIVGLLALEMLAMEPGGKILYDPRLTWNTETLVSEKGIPIMTKTGHAFIKERMRKEKAIYGGEMSAHHYFRDFGYCDSGMIPWLLVSSLLSRQKVPLSHLVKQRMEAFPVSGEINSTVKNPDAVIERVQKEYADGAQESIDGLSVSYPDFRFNIRKSNTEPLLRLNVESRGNKALVENVTSDLLSLIRSNA